MYTITQFIHSLSDNERKNIVFFVPLLFVFGWALTIPAFALLWFTYKGANIATIGILGGAIPLGIFVFGNIISSMSDASGKRKYYIMSILILCIAKIPIMILIPKNIALYMSATLFFVGISIMLPQMDSLIVRLFPIQPNRNFSYLWLRAITTVGFIIGFLVSGKLYDVYSMAMLPWASLIILGICSIIVVWFDDSSIPAHNTQSDTTKFWHIFPDVMRVPWFKAFLLFNLLYGLGGAFYNGFFTIHLTQIGLSNLQIATTISVGCISEIIMFFIGRKIIQKTRPVYFLALCGSVAPIRWILFSIFTDFTPLAVIAGLHGITFALHWCACVYYMERNIPPSLGNTSQNLWQSACLSIPMIVILPLSGILYPIMHANMFLVGAGIAIISTLVPLYMILAKPASV